MLRKSYFRLFLLVGIIIIFFSCNLKDKKNEDFTEGLQDLLNDLNPVIEPIQGSSPNLDDGELSVLGYLKNARIVGLGEATHGSKEFFEMKHRIFKYLVEHFGYKAFAFECDFAESLYFDRYITTGEGDLDELMKNKMIFWTWNTGEVKALLKWMRSYNEDKEEKEMIHYYGVDCQFFRYKADLLSEYLEKVSPGLLKECQSLFDKTRELDSYYNRQNIAVEELTELETSLQWLAGQFEKNENEFVALAGKKEYRIAMQLVRVLEQVKTVAFRSYTSCRDEFMAENSLWVSDLIGGNKKIAVWAHNGHVANDEGWMGHFLREELGDLYQVIGFTFARGSFVAKKETPAGFSSDLFRLHIHNPLKTSINYLFHHADYDNFIFKIDTPPQDSILSNWLAEPRTLLTIGAGYNPENPNSHYFIYEISRAFDVLIHFDEVQAADSFRL